MKAPRLGRWFPITLGLCLVGLLVWILTPQLPFAPLHLYAMNQSAEDIEITVDEIMQGQAQPAVLIDVRTPQEYAQDRIGESVLIPLAEIESGKAIPQVQSLVDAASLEGDPPVVMLYCARGFRSAIAQQHLQEAGIRSLSLAGGITAWRQAIPPSQDQTWINRLSET